ncbi:hypothetical protein E0W68_04645 [Flavobacterium salilacus subsp. salilacus]|uniref:hypothetical protein n=1 Tax=Flavobacterium TaxID=237 RepID=UPI0013894522|nr:MULTISPECIES: hypothetical protein [Flavobacterium]KAF2519638.1 hypothetical protein E0W68_04645 [Flavobacterium salilacus subsp. salilacus]MBE1614460.1 hypothetical protein [Flavobacterium sp. SaA2.13]NDJ00126.1 hypothetical protein [Flavobacterium salilacus subsp. altitudinum]
MKKNLLILGLVAFLSLTATSCSTDDSDMNTETEANTLQPIDNGDKELPKPPMKP